MDKINEQQKKELIAFFGTLPEKIVNKWPDWLTAIMMADAATQRINITGPGFQRTFGLGVLYGQFIASPEIIEKLKEIIDRNAEPVEAKPKMSFLFGRKDDGGKVGRNDPCPCGSGKKYKKCHGG